MCNGRARTVEFLPLKVTLEKFTPQFSNDTTKEPLDRSQLCCVKSTVSNDYFTLIALLFNLLKIVSVIFTGKLSFFLSRVS